MPQCRKLPQNHKTLTQTSSQFPLEFPFSMACATRPLGEAMCSAVVLSLWLLSQDPRCQGLNMHQCETMVSMRKSFAFCRTKQGMQYFGNNTWAAFPWDQHLSLSPSLPLHWHWPQFPEMNDGTKSFINKAQCLQCYDFKPRLGCDSTPC